MPPFAHFASAEAIAGESSAVPFEAMYFDGMVQVCEDPPYEGGGPYEGGDGDANAAVAHRLMQRRDAALKAMMLGMLGRVAWA